MKRFCLILLALIIPLSVYALPYTGSDITLFGSEYSDISGLVADGNSNTWYLNGDAIYTNWRNNWGAIPVCQGHMENYHDEGLLILQKKGP